jgi:outer membrane protein assembly factor BamB
MTPAALAVALFAAALAATASGPRAWPPASGPRAWPQWGGPARNFVTAGETLAREWPAAGPRRIWQRPLGDGFSAIVSDGRTLFTAYREGDKDVTIALDAATGATRWQAAYDAPFVETCSQRLGPVPRAAPLLTDGEVITVSAGGLMKSFDAATGALRWTRDLLDGSPDATRACGYSSSPVAHKGRIYTTVGGKGRGVVALEAATGAIAWQSQDFENGYSSPLVIDLDGRPELVVFTAAEVAGLDPDTGALEWRVPHPADYGVNVAMPVWGEDRLLFVSSAYNGGSRVLRLTREQGTVRVDEVWANKRVRIHFGNAVRVGSRIYASNGDFGAAPFAAVDVTTGETAWRDRSVARSTVIAAAPYLILLDEDGRLALATPGDDGLTVHAKAQITASQSWTAPTLVGTTLYVRDRTQIMALDLGKR